MSICSRSPLMLALALAYAPALHAESASFTYRGQLEEAGLPADGLYDLRLTPYPAPTSGFPVTAPIELRDIPVTEGRFAATVADGLLAEDLGQVWLQVEVRAEGELAWSPLPGRQLADLKGTICPAGWALEGNAGTSPGANFLGTSDDQALELRVRNGRALRLEPSANFWNGLPLTINTLGGSHGNLLTANVRGATIAGGGVAPGGTDPDFTGAARNRITDHYGVIGGGFNNRAGNDVGTLIDAAHATVAGGRDNVASGRASAIAGGEAHLASGIYSSVGGGNGNQATAGGSHVGGGTGNLAGGSNSHIGSGSGNITSGSFSAIGGGEDNTASAFRSGIGGGADHLAQAPASWIGGGRSNTASGDSSSITGGSFNLAAGFNSHIGGGESNVSSGIRSTVGGGGFNTASGAAGTVSGGFRNCAGGSSSWAGGSRAKIRPGSGSGSSGDGCLGIPASGTASGDDGTFVWADTQGTDFISNGTRQFLVRAQGGALFTNGAVNSPEGNRLRVNGTLRVDSLGSAGATTLCRNTINQIATCSSSARYKSDIVDLELGLDTLASLRPVAYTWTESGQADVGFVAEEVAAVDPRLVSRNADGEIEGVKYERLSALLANAVQVLARTQRAQADTLSVLRQDNAALRAELADLRRTQGQILAALEAINSQSPAAELAALSDTGH